MPKTPRMISLRPLTRENWEACVRLQVAESQREFVSSNVYSLAESKFYPEVMPLAIYADDTMVGFLMYGPDEEFDLPCCLIRLMVDQRYQQQGYGRAAMQRLIEQLQTQADLTELYTSYVPGNAVVEKFYADLGFAPTGRWVDDEILVCLRLKE